MSERERLKQLYAPTGRVFIPFLGPSRVAPWPEGEWDIWAPVFSWMLLGRRRPRAWFELHRQRWWRSKKTWRKDYLAWLHRYKARPILMQRKYREVPASVAYPKSTVTSAFPRVPMQGTFDWMLALAIYLEVTDIAIWGMDYDTLHERVYQTGGALYWIGLAQGRGIRLHFSADTRVFSTPMSHLGDYGYDYPPWPKGHHPKDWPEGRPE